MILLDTNVVSAAMQPQFPAPVVTWLNHHTTKDLYLSTITVAEIAYGLRLLPDGQRRALLTDRFEELLARGFEHRVLVFDERAARHYGEIKASRKEIGRPVRSLDAQIAAIARANHLSVATRNTRDFEDCGVDLVNPFEPGTQ